MSGTLFLDFCHRDLTPDKQLKMDVLITVRYLWLLWRLCQSLWLNLNISASIGMIAICCPQRINSTNFGDSLR